MDSLQCPESIGRSAEESPMIIVNPDEKHDLRKGKDVLSFNMLELLRQPQQYLQKIHELNELGIQRVKKHGFEEATKLLTKAEEMINIGKTHCRAIDSDIRICVYYNLACSYQGLWVLQKCKKYCELASEELENLLKSLSDSQKQQKVKKTMFYLKLKLQHCAILSQLNHHQKALETSKSALRVLHETLEIIFDFALSFQPQSQINIQGGDKVIFSKTVNKYLQLLKTLIDTLKEEVSTTRVRKPILYYWKNNPQNNEKLLKQEFANKRIFTKEEEVRSMLGLQHESDWIEQFNIGSIMHMACINYQQFHKEGCFFDEITKKSLYEKVIYCSVIHFTIATQIRFIEDPNKGKEIKKYPMQSKSEAYKMSQLYHLKAIQIMCQGISTCSPYLNHLISSYYKHYLQNLNAIEEHEDSMVEDRSSRKVSIQAQHQRSPSREHNEEYYNQSSQSIHQSKNIPHINIQNQVIPQRTPQKYQEIESQEEDEQDDVLLPTSSRKPQKKKLKKTKLVHPIHLEELKPRLANARRSETLLADEQKYCINMDDGLKTYRSGSKIQPSKIRELKSKSPQGKSQIRKKGTKSSGKTPLSIIKKAFQHNVFKGGSVLLTQKTSTQINVLLKKKK